MGYLLKSIGGIELNFLKISNVLSFADEDTKRRSKKAKKKEKKKKRRSSVLFFNFYYGKVQIYIKLHKTVK